MSAKSGPSQLIGSKYRKIAAKLRTSIKQNKRAPLQESGVKLFSDTSKRAPGMCHRCDRNEFRVAQGGQDWTVMVLAKFYLVRFVRYTCNIIWYKLCTSYNDQTTRLLFGFWVYLALTLDHFSNCYFCSFPLIGNGWLFICCIIYSVYNKQRTC